MADKKGGLGSDMGSMFEKHEINGAKSEYIEKTEKVNVMRLEELYEKNMKQPRISFWDLASKIVLDYISETTPQFSRSKEISNVLHEYLEREYPELWDEVKQLLSD
nr:hypothetical protein [uncultured Methanobacterium sp.]